MIFDRCPCCEITALPHTSDCTFASDCPAECEQFDEVAELRAEVARLRLRRATQEDEDADWLRRAIAADKVAIAKLEGEIERLRFAIRRLADQDDTLSACEGAVTVTIDGTLTTEERERVAIVADWASEHLGKDDPGVVALVAFLERTKERT